jgi:cysteine desulfurase
MLLGGGQEGGRRAGTENVLLIAALGAACEVATTELVAERTHMLALRARLLSRFAAAESKGEVSIRTNGPADPEQRLPNTLSIGLRGVQSGALLLAIKDKVAASAGSACHTGGGVSAILKAMDVPMEYAVGTLRLSVGRHTTIQNVDAAADAILAAAVAQLAASQ